METELKSKKYEPHFPVVTHLLFRPKSKRSFSRTSKSANSPTSSLRLSKNLFNISSSNSYNNQKRWPPKTELLSLPQQYSNMHYLDYSRMNSWKMHWMMLMTWSYLWERQKVKALKKAKREPSQRSRTSKQQNSKERVGKEWKHKVVNNRSILKKKKTDHCCLFAILHLSSQYNYKLFQSLSYNYNYGLQHFQP